MLYINEIKIKKKTKEHERNRKKIVRKQKHKLKMYYNLFHHPNNR